MPTEYKRHLSLALDFGRRKELPEHIHLSLHVSPRICSRMLGYSPYSLIWIELDFNATTIGVGERLVEVDHLSKGIGQGGCRYISSRDDVAAMNVSLYGENVVKAEPRRRDELIPGYNRDVLHDWVEL